MNKEDLIKTIKIRECSNGYNLEYDDSKYILMNYIFKTDIAEIYDSEKEIEEAINNSVIVDKKEYEEWSSYDRV